MAFDFKKEYKEFYLPPKRPEICTLPPMNYVAVQGHGNPNDPQGEYQASIGLLYAIAYTIKMSKKGSRDIAGYFDFVVPPLEGLWWQDGVLGMDYSRKDKLHFLSMIRLPDFVTEEVFAWAVEEAQRKKKLDCTKAFFFPYAEGTCVQCMHLGSYDAEPATVQAMEQFMVEQGYTLDMASGRHHHEIYLSDPRRCEPEKLKTVIRHPIRKL